MATHPSRLGVTLTPRGARTMSKILEAAGRLFSREGLDRASMFDVAQAAGVSKGLLHYHFTSKEHLALEALGAIFRLVYRRFEDRFARGERGLGTALEAMDARWQTVRDLRGQAPFLVETMSLAGREGPLQAQIDQFYAEAMALLEQGITAVFRDQPTPIPPDRLARLVRLSLHGLVVELALARSEAELQRIDAAYADLRRMLEHYLATA